MKPDQCALLWRSGVRSPAAFALAGVLTGYVDPDTGRVLRSPRALARAVLGLGDSTYQKARAALLKVGFLTVKKRQGRRPVYWIPTSRRVRIPRA